MTVPPRPRRRPGGRPTTRQNVLLGVVLLVLAGLGVGSLLVGASERRGSRPVPGGVRTTGTVVGTRTHTAARGGQSYAGRISFTTEDGRSVEFTGTYLGHRPRVGSTVPVSYAPADPAGAHELVDSHSWVVNDVIGVLLVAAALLGAALRSRRMLRRRR